jgi:SAM-dependent methyltransferase
MNMTEQTITTETELCAAILKLVAEEAASNPVTYNSEQPYQSYERIGFEGMRWSVEKRIREYGLEQFYNPGHAVLDIGSNFGFFVAEFAHHCRLAHGIEPNPHLNKIGELTSKFLGVEDKVKYFDQMFADFENPVPYDTIYSLAAFYTGDGRERSSAEFYFSKVNGMLADGGRLFYESTSYSKVKTSEGYEGYPACLAAMEAIGTHLELLKEWETPSGSPEYSRQFAIARKKT